MNDLLYKLEKLKNMYTKYELSINEIDALCELVKENKAYISIIGSSCSGKSTLVNMLLGFSRAFVKVSETPITTVFTEIKQGKENGELFGNLDDSISNDEVQTRILEFQEYNRLEINRVKNLVLVDMPTFNQKNKNKYFEYIFKSQVVIILISADTMSLNGIEEVIEQINESVRIAVVISKYDCRNIETFDKDLKSLKENIQVKTKRSDLPYYYTDCMTGELDGLEKFFYEIQNSWDSLILRDIEYQIKQLKGTIINKLNNIDLEHKELRKKLEKQKININSYIHKKTILDKECFNSNTLKQIESKILTIVEYQKYLEEYKIDVSENNIINELVELFEITIEKVDYVDKKIKETVKNYLFDDTGFKTSINIYINNYLIYGLDMEIMNKMVDLQIERINNIFNIMKNDLNKEYNEILSEINRQLLNVSRETENISSDMKALKEI